MLNYDFSKGHIGINLYSALINKELSEEEKAKLIAEAVEEVAKKFPNLENLSTKDDVEITKLELQREIRELDNKLSREIQENKLELQREIKEAEVKLTKEIESSKSTFIKWSFLFWISQVGVVLGVGFMIMRSLGKI